MLSACRCPSKPTTSPLGRRSSSSRKWSAASRCLASTWPTTPAACSWPGTPASCPTPPTTTPVSSFPLYSSSTACSASPSLSTSAACSQSTWTASPCTTACSKARLPPARFLTRPPRLPPRRLASPHPLPPPQHLSAPRLLGRVTRRRGVRRRLRLRGCPPPPLRCARRRGAQLTRGLPRGAPCRPGAGGPAVGAALWAHRRSAGVHDRHRRGRNAAVRLLQRVFGGRPGADKMK